MENKLFNMEELRAAATGYSGALVYSLSTVQLAAVDGIDLAELMEAWFFRADGEMHVVKEAGAFHAYIVSDSNFTDYIDVSYLLEAKFGKKVSVRRYIEYDEDGQAYVAYVRLLNW